MSMLQSNEYDPSRSQELYQKMTKLKSRIEIKRKRKDLVSKNEMQVLIL